MTRTHTHTHIILRGLCLRNGELQEYGNVTACLPQTVADQHRKERHTHTSKQTNQQKNEQAPGLGLLLLLNALLHSMNWCSGCDLGSFDCQQLGLVLETRRPRVKKSQTAKAKKPVAVEAILIASASRDAGSQLKCPRYKGRRAD